MTGFEPVTSCSQSKRSSQAELHPGFPAKNPRLLYTPETSRFSGLEYLKKRDRIGACRVSFGARGDRV